MADSAASPPLTLDKSSIDANVVQSLTLTSPILDLVADGGGDKVSISIPSRNDSSSTIGDDVVQSLALTSPILDLVADGDDDKVSVSIPSRNETLDEPSSIGVDDVVQSMALSSPIHDRVVDGGGDKVSVSIPTRNETLDESSCSIGVDVVQSMALTSPIRDRDDVISIPSRNETLDESSSSTIASIGANVVQSLALTSPIRDRDDVGGGDKETLTVSSQVKGTRRAKPAMNHPFQYGRDETNEPRLSLSNCPENSWDLNNHHRHETYLSSNFSSGYDVDDDEYLMGMYDPYQRRYQQEPFTEYNIGAGLWNLGNSCFVNSVLQCFTHTVPLIQSLRAYKYQYPCNCYNMMNRFCVLWALQRHIKLALRTSRCSISPSHFLDNINYFSPDFRRYQQEDAHEFLQAFLDKLERCCLERRSDRGDNSSQDGNFVQRIFGGRLVSKLRCCSCGSVSETFENSVGLSLEIEDVDNLYDALESFTSVEKLEDQMTCDKCEEKVSKEKQLLLENLPPVVTFHLKRFKNNGYFMEKISKHVRFPLELDLESENSEVATKYRLYAFVEHLGSLAYGHYISYVRSEPKLWHKFDDKQVTMVNEEDVLSRDSYILFYAREDIPWFFNAFDEMQPLLGASLNNFSPKSVLDPSNGECSSEISYENVNKSNKPCDSHANAEENYVSLSDESTTESSGEDSPMEEELLDPVYDTYPPFTEPSQREIIDSRLAIEKAMTGDVFVPVPMVQNQDLSPKQQEGGVRIQLEHLESAKNQDEPCKQALISKEEPFEDVSLSSAESNGEDTPMPELLDSLETDGSYAPASKKELDSCVPTGDEFVPVVMAQIQDSTPEQQEETFQQLLLFDDDEAGYMETEEVANDDELAKKQSPRGRELYVDVAYSDGSPIKRMKTESEDNENL
ncbi:hypothetical protein AALP_AA7G001000 [Arabis alpina]|uniref:Ubiquitin carboxyl-terminal hydrolase n=1 Tax=Arabis alpina TaxID=50452 RepID=A0A087GF23_ARAAL|nr:hypothetical protein AALP_AA7G001000 [Arabis alpina]